LFNIVVSPKLHCADKLGDRRPTCRTPLNLRLENKHPGYKIVCIEKSVREGQKPSSAVPEEHHDRWRIEVLTKTKIAFAAALILGTASAALAGGNSGEYSGGSDIGPLGQCFSPPTVAADPTPLVPTMAIAARPMVSLRGRNTSIVRRVSAKALREFNLCPCLSIDL
jgi:hypothetical protein